MSSQILKLVAAIMLIGSLILIAIAYRLSSPSSDKTSTPAKAPEISYQIVTANRPLQPGDVISEADVTSTPTTIRPANAFDTPKEVLGRRLTNTIAPGKPILAGDLATGNPIAQSLKTNERAIAIKVSEVIGVGGFIHPGDAVDVIAFIRKDNESVKENQAVVMLHAVRVLSYGTELPAPDPATDKSPSKGETVKSKTGINTAVIAVDADQTALVALVENLGLLRLALRPAGAAVSEELPSPTTLNDVAAPTTQIVAPDKSPGSIIEIYHGAHVEQVQYP